MFAYISTGVHLVREANSCIAILHLVMASMMLKYCMWCVCRWIFSILLKIKMKERRKKNSDFIYEVWSNRIRHFAPFETHSISVAHYIRLYAHIIYANGIRRQSNLLHIGITIMVCLRWFYSDVNTSMNTRF